MKTSVILFPAVLLSVVAAGNPKDTVQVVPTPVPTKTTDKLGVPIPAPSTAVEQSDAPTPCPTTVKQEISTPAPSTVTDTIPAPTTSESCTYVSVEGDATVTLLCKTAFETLPSWTGTSSCVAPVDAVCARVKSGVWGCVYGQPEAGDFPTPAPTTPETYQQPNPTPASSTPCPQIPGWEKTPMPAPTPTWVDITPAPTTPCPSQDVPSPTPTWVDITPAPTTPCPSEKVPSPTPTYVVITPAPSTPWPPSSAPTPTPTVPKTGVPPTPAPTTPCPPSDVPTPTPSIPKSTPTSAPTTPCPPSDVPTPTPTTPESTPTPTLTTPCPPSNVPTPTPTIPEGKPTPISTPCPSTAAPPTKTETPCPTTNVPKCSTPTPSPDTPDQQQQQQQNDQSQGDQQQQQQNDQNQGEQQQQGDSSITQQIRTSNAASDTTATTSSIGAGGVAAFVAGVGAILAVAGFGAYKHRQRADSRRSLHVSLSPLLSTEQTQRLLEGGGRVRFLDASWYLDKSRDAKREFAAERLPGAQFFDIEQVADATSTLPHMLPTRETTTRWSSTAASTASGESGERLGEWRETTDRGGGCAQSGALLVDVQKVVAGAAYKAKPNEVLAVSWEDVLNKIGTDTQIVDARGAARFYAKEPEPRPGMRGGHIPGSVNVPFGKLVSPDDFSVRWQYDAIQRQIVRMTNLDYCGRAGPGDIVVKNRFLGINSTDVNLTNGMYNDKLPFFAGVYGVGIVTEVGIGVASVNVGDAVIIQNNDNSPKPAPLLSWEANEKILMKSASIRGFFMYHFEEHIWEHTERLLKLVSEGKLNPGVDPTEYKDFMSIPDAIDRMFARQNIGKLIVKLE
ncbi:unnamed protein product [Phytophthora lilii]|uniref:Unnamed protein product n=1 Tax=Phytophthora lilii TaxID=2077276 RepID=A0A9W6WQ67_9STRA|nr:unnamed protein product [Phytophthora lilii]